MLLGPRPTGIDVVGDAPWGTHFCQFYLSAEDMVEILVPYFRAGLLGGEHCMWITSPPLGVDDAWEALGRAVPDLAWYRERGRIEILPHTEWYLQDDRFDSDRVLSGWVSRHDAALARGCTGLRLSGNTFWLERSAWHAFAEYEAAVDSVLGRYRMLALCTYSLERCGAVEIIDVIRNHQFALIKRDGVWDRIASVDRERLEVTYARDRHSAWETLREQKEWLGVALASIGDAVLVTDAAGAVTFMNTAAERLTGFPASEAIGRPHAEVIPLRNEDSGLEEPSPVERVIATGAVQGLANHTVLLTRTGHALPIDDSAAPIFDPSGALRGVVLVFRDVTAARTAALALRQRGAILEGINRILVESLTCETEPRLGEACLKVAVSLTGSRFGFIAELNGDNRLDAVAISPEAWGASRFGPSVLGPMGDLPIHGIYGRVIEDGVGLIVNRPGEHPARVGLPEGHFPLESFLGAPLRSAGKIVGMVALANKPGGYSEADLEALEAIAPSMMQALYRKRAEVWLKRSRAMLGATEELAHLGSWELDVLRNRLTWSDETYRIFGLVPQEFSATYEAFLGMVHPEDRAEVDAAYSGSVREGRDSYELEHRIVRRSSGEIRTVHEKCEHLRDAEGRIVRSLGMVHDITEKRRLEEARERHLAAIEEANETKDLFLNTLSHELRTPLAATRSAVELLRSERLTEPQRGRALDLMERNVLHQIRLIDDLLDLSRVVRKKLKVEWDLVDLREIVTSQAESVELAAHTNRVALEVSLPDAPVVVRGDWVRMGQVVSNLINNALKFTEPEGQVTCTVAAEGDDAVVRVSDTGIGIEPHALPGLFEAFRQVETSLHRRNGGLGIGLPIARSLAELHGGTLHGMSDGLGRGSEFTLRLPLCREKRSAQAPCRELSVSGSPRNVLLVEDGADLRETMTLILELMGHTVTVAMEGRSAVAIARRDEPDIAIIDIGLPDIDGYEVARQLRGDPATRGIRLIALTGYTTPEHRQRAIKAGFDYHLIKPVDSKVLERVLACDCNPGEL